MQNAKCKMQNAKYRFKSNIMIKSYSAESVGMILLCGYGDWVRQNERKQFKEYGNQRWWKKIELDTDDFIEII